jgi:hypothetical protein
MDIIEFGKKLVSGFAILCIFGGTVTAVVSAHFHMLDVSTTGLILILLGSITMEVMLRKSPKS